MLRDKMDNIRVVREFWDKWENSSWRD